MGISDGEIKFMIFYLTFLAFIVAIVGYVDLNIFEGVSQAQIDALNNPVELNLNPLSWFSIIVNFISRFTFLLSVSTEFVFLGVILGVLSTVALIIFIKFIVESIPFT